MRAEQFKHRKLKSAVAFFMMAVLLTFAMPFESFAVEGASSLKERHVWFTYGCTDCIGREFPCSVDCIGYYEGFATAYPVDYAVFMMLCDTDHVVHVEGDGLKEGEVVMTSLDPDVLDIDSEGNVTLKKTGKAEIRATVPADDTYKECKVSLTVTVDRHDGWVGEYPVYYAGRSPARGLDLDTSDGPQQLVAPVRPGASARFSTTSTDVVIVEPDGLVTPVSPGSATLRIDVSGGGGKYKEGYFLETIHVTGEDVRQTQQISGDLGPYIIDWHDGLALDLHAQTDLSYYIYGPGEGVASVDGNGFVTFNGTGTVSIKVTAAQTADYKMAEAIITIEARDYAAEEAAQQAAEQEIQQAEEQAAQQAAEQEAQQAAEEAARKAEIAKAKSLKKPALTIKALKGKKIKLTWSKVKDADGYIVYVKYPGKSKYAKAVTKKATVKSVTHKGLSKNRVYYYKVRAYKKVNGKVYYGPFSKVRKARVK